MQLQRRLRRSVSRSTQAHIYDRASGLPIHVLTFRNLASPRSSSPIPSRTVDEVDARGLSPARQGLVQTERTRTDLRTRREDRRDEDRSLHPSNERARKSQSRRLATAPASDEDDNEYRRDVPLYNAQTPNASRDGDRNGRLVSSERRLYSVNGTAGTTSNSAGGQAIHGVPDQPSTSGYVAVDRKPRSRTLHEAPSSASRQPVVESSTRTPVNTQAHDRNTIWSREIPEASTSQSRSQPGRKLFNPSIHDPLAFQRNVTPTYPGMATAAESSRIAERNHCRQGLPRKLYDANLANQDQALYERHLTSMNGQADNGTTLTSSGVGGRGLVSSAGRMEPSRTLMHELEDEDVAADRAREKRKRKEGSEKGSLGIGGARKRDEERSRGSRSSEGSESLKDRERGRGKR